MLYDIIDGIMIGGVGGAVAGLTVWGVQLAREKCIERKHKKRVYGWLKAHTNREGPQFRSTRAIASHNDLTEDRIRYICSIDDRIHLSTGPEKDKWGLKAIVEPTPEVGSG